MSGYVINIEEETVKNKNFRRVLFTATQSQLVLMTLKPNQDIGMEVHEENDQFFRIESGQGKAIIDGEEHDLSDGVAVVIPAGSKHNIINTSSTEDMTMYTIYSPAHHPDQTIHATKEEALAAEAEEGH